MSQRANQSTIDARVQQVYEWLLDAKTRRQILQEIAIASPPWDVSTRTVDYYIATAHEWIAEQAAQQRERSFNLALGRCEKLYSKAVAADDLKAALAIEKHKCDLLNLYPPKRTELTGKDGGPLQSETKVTLSDDDRRSALAALCSRVGSAGVRPDTNGHADPNRSALG